MKNQKGFTLIELLIVVAIIGIIAAIAVPGLLRARMSGNETSAIGSLRAVHSGQVNFHANCGAGWFAGSLVSLATAPTAGGDAFISPDLGTDPSTKSGYTVALTAGATAGPAAMCNAGATADSYATTGVPVTPGSTGTRYFHINSSGAIYQDDAVIAADQSGPPATGTLLQ